MAPLAAGAVRIRGRNVHRASLPLFGVGSASWAALGCQQLTTGALPHGSSRRPCNGQSLQTSDSGNEQNKEMYEKGR